MEGLLVTTEVIVVTALTFILALVIQPLLVMAVLGLASKAAQLRPHRQDGRELRIAELRLLATATKSSPRE